MRGRSMVLGGLLLALLAVPAVPGNGLAGLSGSEATLAGEAAATASLAGIVIEGPACAGRSNLSLSAVRGVLAIDNESVDLYVTSTVQTNSTSHPETYALSNASADGFDLREGCRLLALPLEGASLQASALLQGGGFLPPTGQALSFTPRASFDRTSNRTLEVAAGALPYQPGQPGTLTLRGPFRLVVWEASFLLHDGNGTRPFRTGEERPAVGGGPLLPGPQVQREAFFDVEDGTLAVPVGPAVQVYMDSLRLDLRSGRLALHHPQGTLPISDAPVPAGSRLLELEGPAVVVLAPLRGRVGADIRDDPPVAYIDGVAVRPDPPVSWTAPLLAALMALAVAVLATRWILTRRARRRMDEIAALLEAQRLDEAMALVPKAKAHRATREEARLAEATYLIRTSRFAEARDALAGGGWDAGTGPLRDYLLATAEAGSGQRGAATAHLARCLLSAPAFATEALANPLLAGVVRDAMAANRPASPGESYA